MSRPFSELRKNQKSIKRRRRNLLDPSQYDDGKEIAVKPIKNKVSINPNIDDINNVMEKLGGLVVEMFETDRWRDYLSDAENLRLIEARKGFGKDIEKKSKRKKRAKYLTDREAKILDLRQRPNSWKGLK